MVLGSVWQLQQNVSMLLTLRIRRIDSFGEIGSLLYSNRNVTVFNLFWSILKSPKNRNVCASRKQYLLHNQARYTSPKHMQTHKKFIFKYRLYKHVLNHLIQLSTRTARKPMQKEQKEYQVQKIIDKKRIGARIFYLIRWKEFQEEEPTWEPLQNLYNCQAAIKKYELDQKSILQKKRNLKSFMPEKVFQKSKEVKKAEGKVAKMKMENYKINKIEPIRPIKNADDNRERSRSRQRMGRKRQKERNQQQNGHLDLRASKISQIQLHNSQVQPRKVIENSEELQERWMSIFSGLAEKGKQLNGAKSNVSNKDVKNGKPKAQRPVLALNFKKKSQPINHVPQQNVSTKAVPDNSIYEEQKSMKLEQSCVQVGPIPSFKKVANNLANSIVSRKSVESVANLPQMGSQHLIVSKQMIRINKQQSISILSAKNNLQVTIQELLAKKQPPFRVEFYQQINKAMTCLALSRQKAIKPYIDKYMLQLKRQAQAENGSENFARNHEDENEK